MAAVASKNPFDLLGNDIEDENEIPKAPSKEVVKKTTSSKKRDEAPAPTPTVTESSRGGFNRRGRGDGNEAAFRDRNNGRQSNRSRPTDESGGLKERGEYRGRGGRGRGRQFDRHSATNRTDTDKQVSQGWGSNKGPSEWNDEQAGETIAQEEATAEAVATTEGEAQPETTEGEAAAAEPAPEPEPEDKRVSYAQYIAEKSIRGPVEELPEIRGANEGARENKKWATAKELVKETGEEYFSGGKLKPKNQKQRKERSVVEIDHQFVDPRELRRSSGDRGGRGGRGGARGDRPARGRGEYRGGRGGPRGGSLNVSDESAFPSLGSK
ncbi:hypothetical protein ABW19_dt0200774 [Dactylella cylindrospora]|nr:hypothetical protein ABW19_dt0200774 [Dactylella cylindrospora]